MEETIYGLIEKGRKILEKENIQDIELKLREIILRIFKEINKNTYIVSKREKIKDIIKEKINTNIEEEYNKRIKEYNNCVEKLSKNIPLEYILGYTYFYGNKIIVSEDTLIPRLDTEILVKEVIEELDRKIEVEKKENIDIKILEIGVGSGALICAVLDHIIEKHIKNKREEYNKDKNILKNNYTIEIKGIDISKEAIKIAKENIQNIQKKHLEDAKNLDLELDLELKKEIEKIKVSIENVDVFEIKNTKKLGEKFDIIYSNPPYITEEEMKKLDEEVKKEPIIALYGGKDGLDYYRHIINMVYNSKKTEKTKILFEIGYMQGEALKQIAILNGYKNIEIIKDFEDRDRVVKIWEK